MTSADEPHDTLPEEQPEQQPEQQQRPLPVSGLDALYTAAFSGVIKNIQRSIAPALRVRIPAIPASAFKLPRIQPPVVPTVHRDITRQLAAALQPVLRAQREQLTKVMAGVATALQRVYPENWRGVTGLRFKTLEGILLDEGIPFSPIAKLVDHG